LGKGETFSFTGKKNTFNLDTMHGHVIRMVVPTPQSPPSPASTFERFHMKPEIVIIVIQKPLATWIGHGHSWVHYSALATGCPL
jgi:hypothetical protein